MGTLMLDVLSQLQLLSGRGECLLERPLYLAIYNSKIFFPAKITSYNHDDWSCITSRAIMAFLPKMGFNHHMKRYLAFAPRSYGGIGLTHGYAKQGAEGICHILTHL